MGRVITPARVGIRYKVESSFSTDPSITDDNGLEFGLDSRFTGIRVGHKLMPLGNIGIRTIQNFATGEEEGGASIAWSLTSPWFWQLLLGVHAVADSGSVKVHTFTKSAVEKTFQLLTRMRTNEAGDDSDAFSLAFDGSVLDTVSLSCNTGEYAKCQANIMSGDVNITESTGLEPFDAVPEANDDRFPYTFVHGQVEIPDGTTLQLVQRLNLSLASGQKLYRAFGTGKAQDAYPGQLLYSGDVTLAAETSKDLKRVLEDTESTVTIVFDNKKTGAAQLRQELEFTGCRFEDTSFDAQGLDVILMANKFQARELTVKCTNVTASLQS